MFRGLRVGSCCIALSVCVVAQDCDDPPVCARITYTPVIFIGHVLEHNSSRYRFAVDEAFKGIPKGAQTFELDALHQGFNQGRQYLVLATVLPDGDPLADSCTGSRPLDEAQEGAKFLREWAAGKNVTRIQGRIAQEAEDSMVRYELDFNHAKPFPGVEVTATRGRRKFKGVSDQTGFFQINLPVAGDYILTAGRPGFISHYDQYELSVEPNSCTEQDIGMWLDNVVSGRLLDSKSKPVRGVPVEIAAFEENENRVSGSSITDQEGRYEIRGLPIGEYILGVNLSGLNSSLPFAPRFFPGVSRRDQAIPIRVEGAQKILEKDFTIEARKEIRQITARIKWPDGSPVTNVIVDCLALHPAEERISRYTDAKGEVRFVVLSDRDFAVQADRLFWSHSARPVRAAGQRPKIKVPAGRTPALVEITIDAFNDMRPREAPLDMSSFNEPRAN